MVKIKLIGYPLGIIILYISTYRKGTIVELLSISNGVHIGAITLLFIL